VSILVVGVSHKSAPVSVLERVSPDDEGLHKLIADVASSEHVLEATALSTCNRVEIYAEVDRFHGSVETVSRLLCELAGERPEDVVPYLYVHYDDGAVSHLFHVAAGLDSMVVGESQVLAQVREALRLGQESGVLGPALNAAFQQALRVGKRVHAETDVAVCPHCRLAGIEAHSDAYVEPVGPGESCEGPLAGDRRHDRVLRLPEGEEEGVALGIDLAPAHLHHGLSQQPLVLCEHGVVALTPKRVEQTRRALDVREQEGDGPGRDVRRQSRVG